MSEYSLNEPWGPIVYLKAETNVFIPFQTPRNYCSYYWCTCTVSSSRVIRSQLFCLCFTYYLYYYYAYIKIIKIKFSIIIYFYTIYNVCVYKLIKYTMYLSYLYVYNNIRMEFKI